jgi:hypothetical protein
MDPWLSSRTIDTAEAPEAESIARALEVLGGAVTFGPTERAAHDKR